MGFSCRVDDNMAGGGGSWEEAVLLRGLPSSVTAPAAPRNAGPVPLQCSDGGVLKYGLEALVFSMGCQVLQFA